MTENLQDDPKHKKAAALIAKAFKSRPLSWRVQFDNKTLVVILYSGPKVDGDIEGNPNGDLLAQLFPHKPKAEDDEQTTDREAELNEREKALAAREAALEAKEKASAKKNAVVKDASPGASAGASATQDNQQTTATQ